MNLSVSGKHGICSLIFIEDTESEILLIVEQGSCLLVHWYDSLVWHIIINIKY